MNDFQWLEDIVRARTPGTWKRNEKTPHVLCYADNEKIYRIARVHTVRNANFVATMGTIADKIMDVVKAAQAFQKPVHRGMGDVEAECLDRLNKALTALQACHTELGQQQ